MHEKEGGQRPGIHRNTMRVGCRGHEKGNSTSVQDAGCHRLKSPLSSLTSSKTRRVLIDNSRISVEIET